MTISLVTRGARIGKIGRPLALANAHLMPTGGRGRGAQDAPPLDPEGERIFNQQLVVVDRHPLGIIINLQSDLKLVAFSIDRTFFSRGGGRRA